MSILNCKWKQLSLNNTISCLPARRQLNIDKWLELQIAVCFSSEIVSLFLRVELNGEIELQIKSISNLIRFTFRTDTFELLHYFLTKVKIYQPKCGCAKRRKKQILFFISPTCSFINKSKGKNMICFSFKFRLKSFQKCHSMTISFLKW